MEGRAQGANCGGLAFLMLIVLLVGAGCGADDEHPSRYDEDSVGATPEGVEPCSTPETGCPCEEAGLVSDCGRVSVDVDGYQVCFDGGRVCAEDGTWGDCVPDEDIVAAGQ